MEVKKDEILNWRSRLPAGYFRNGVALSERISPYRSISAADRRSYTGINHRAILVMVKEQIRPQKL